MGASRNLRPACEFDRAYHELIGASRPEAGGAASPCSPETPEVRDYPAPRTGAAPYVLCNGHLRDLFDAQSRLAPAVPAPALP